MSFSTSSPNLLVQSAYEKKRAARSLLLASLTMNTSQCLYEAVLRSIFKAPMSFFDTTQILDRSSTDQATVDSDPNLAGLAVTYGLQAWNVCNVQSKMISSSVIEGHRPRSDWPETGSIDFQNLQVRNSANFPLVLKGITCTSPGEKRIGIVGRTGSGKSTLIQAIFRLVEPSQGKIIIDGVDISRIGLRDLSSKLSIIPQEPTLFQGTVRNNLDPLQEDNDHDIWEVVKKCNLTDMQQNGIGSLLDATVSEEGENWSLGQRQLIFLARILLQKRKILVLDEATDSMDTETDMLVQKSIRSETNNCTVITIAHRIATILDSDLVLDDGYCHKFLSSS